MPPSTAALLVADATDVQMRDPNAPIQTPQPLYSRSMFAAFGRSAERGAVLFVSRAAAAGGLRGELGLAKELVAVEHTCSIGKSDMIWNNAMPKIKVNHETYEVRADGELLTL